MSDKTAVSTTDAPAPMPVFSQGVRKGNILQVSGQGSVDPATGEFVFEGDVKAQTTRVLQNIEAILTAGGASFDDVVMLRVYLTTRDDFVPMNEAYGEFVGAHDRERRTAVPDHRLHRPPAASRCSSRSTPSPSSAKRLLAPRPRDFVGSLGPGVCSTSSPCPRAGALSQIRTRWVAEGTTLDPTEQSRQTAAARADFLSSGTAAPRDVPEVVAASWQRSIQAGVDPDQVRAEYFSDLDTSSRLVRCSQPILDRLSEDTADIPLSIALTDSKARLLTRLDTSPAVGARLDNISFASGFGYAETDVGTNGVGTVFEAGRSVHVVGAQHFHQRLQPFACAGAPIRDPLSGHIEGVLDISCLAEHSNPLMHSLVRSAAQQIERNLLLDRSRLQQAVFETFVRVDSRTRGAVVAVGGSVVMANAVAQALFDAHRATLDPGAPAVPRDATGQGGRRDRAPDRQGRPDARDPGAREPGRGRHGGRGGAAEPRNPCPSRRTAVGRIRRDSARSDTSSVRHPLAGFKKLSGSGQSPLWKRACAEIAAALAQHQSLLVIGETGTGKFSLVAEMYHSVTPDGRSMLIDAAELCEGLVRQCRGGAGIRHASDAVDLPQPRRTCPPTGWSG